MSHLNLPKTDLEQLSRDLLRLSAMDQAYTMPFTLTDWKQAAEKTGVNRETIAHLTMLHDAAIQWGNDSAWDAFYSAANLLEACSPMASPAFRFYLSLKQAITSGAKRVKETYTDIEREACYHCDGTGRIEDPDDFPNIRTCPICAGTGGVPAPAPTGADAALSALEKETYTDLWGKVIEVESLLWLEDGRYYDEEQGEYCDCSRYCTNSEEKDADGESVWLNEDYQEVDPDAEPDYDEEESEEVDE